MTNELSVIKHPKSGTSEAIKTLRTNLQFSSVDEKVKSILITSSMSGEGKSYISANLAAAFAQADLKVLIVDCDMRRGRQHKIFGLDNEKGLSNLLIEDVTKKWKKYVQKTEIPNLEVLTMGIIPPNPSELLASEKNKLLVSILEEEYDIVIYDGVPACGLTDSIIMAGLVDKIAIVCACKQTPIELLQSTKKNLESYKNKIAGVIVNKLPVKNNKYYNYYYK